MAFNASDPRIRSGLNFVAFLIIVTYMALFVLQKATEAIEEIDRLSQMPVFSAPRNIN